MEPGAWIIVGRWMSAKGKVLFVKRLHAVWWSTLQQQHVNHFFVEAESNHKFRYESHTWKTFLAFAYCTVINIIIDHFNSITPIP